MNQLCLTACIIELDALRYTPAGLPAINLQMSHEGELEEAGQRRTVSAVVKAVAIGPQADVVKKLVLNQPYRFDGFVATPRNGKHLVFHIQQVSQA